MLFGELGSTDSSSHWWSAWARATCTTRSRRRWKRASPRSSTADPPPAQPAGAVHTSSAVLKNPFTYSVMNSSASFGALSTR